MRSLRLSVPRGGIFPWSCTQCLHLCVPLHHLLHRRLPFSPQDPFFVTSCVKDPLTLLGSFNCSLGPVLRHTGRLRSGRLSTMPKITQRAKGEQVSLCSFMSCVMRPSGPSSLFPDSGGQVCPGDTRSQPSRRESQG